MADYDPGNLETALNRIADPTFGQLVSDAELFWLWDMAQQRIVWANPAALKFWDAASVMDIAAREQSLSVHGNQQLDRIGKRLGNGTGCLERLRYFRHGREINLTCKVTADRLDGSRMLRVQSMGARSMGARQPKSDPQAIYNFITGSIPAAALLIRANGDIIAANAEADALGLTERETDLGLGQQIVDFSANGGAALDNIETINLANGPKRFSVSTRSIPSDPDATGKNGAPLLLAALIPLADDGVEDDPVESVDDKSEKEPDLGGLQPGEALDADDHVPQQDAENSALEETDQNATDISAPGDDGVDDGVIENVDAGETSNDDDSTKDELDIDAAGLVAAVNDAFGKTSETQIGTAKENIVPFRTHEPEAPDDMGDDDENDDDPADIEKDAFQAIAEALGARLERSQTQTHTGSEKSDDDGQIPRTEQDAQLGRMPDQLEMKALLTRLPIAIFVYRGSDARGVSEPIFANRALLSLFGYNSVDNIKEAGGVAAILPKSESQQERGKRFGDIAVIGEHVEAIDEVQGAGDGQGETRDLFIHDSSGVRISVNARLQAIKWDGQNAMMMSILKADRARPGGTPASDSERRRQGHGVNVESILDQVLDAYLILDTDGVVLSLNRGAKAMFSVPDTAIVGHPFSRLLRAPSDHGAETMFAAIRDKLPGKDIDDGCEVIARVPGGADMPYFLKIHPLEKAGNSLFCAIFGDISRWKLVEQEQTDAREQAERDNQQKSTFLAKIGHEIRTPLNSILGFSEAILEEKFGALENPKYLEYVKNINEGGTHLLSLINDLLDLSKVEAGKMELDFTNVNLNDVVAGTVMMMQLDANKARIIIRSNLAPNLADVVADLRSLKQICLNLLSNAIKFTDPGGQVIVASRMTAHGEIELRVQDTGTGMNNRELEAALEPFQQLDNQQNDTPGTGLGLPLTKALVEENRARFDIESSKGHGTLVKITFPVNRVLAD